jgi:hypothetical protein
MTAAIWILFVLGLLGAADIVLFHTLAHGIRRHPDCRTELLVHALRGPTYALLFAGVPNLGLHGAWFWTLCALLAFDLLLSVVDFLVERRSRARLGGLPTGEYLLHVLLGILFGAFVALLLSATASWSSLPTALAWQPAAVPDLLRWTLVVMAAGVLASGAMDAAAWWRMRSAAARGRSEAHRHDDHAPDRGQPSRRFSAGA